MQSLLLINMEIFFTSNIIILSPKEGIYFHFDAIYLKTEDFLYMIDPIAIKDITVNASKFMIGLSHELECKYNLLSIHNIYINYNKIYMASIYFGCNVFCKWLYLYRYFYFSSIVIINFNNIFAHYMFSIFRIYFVFHIIHLLKILSALVAWDLHTLSNRIYTMPYSFK